jgi:hypothetical protein
MAKNLSKSGILTGQTIEASEISQSIDALTGIEAYNLTFSGSLNLLGCVVTGSISNAITASHALNSSGFTPSLSTDIIARNITSSGNVTSVGFISASGGSGGGNIIGTNFSSNPVGTGVNKITMATSNRIDIAPNNTTAIRVTDSLVTNNKNTFVNGHITASSNISASGILQSPQIQIGKAYPGPALRIDNNAYIYISSSRVFVHNLPASDPNQLDMLYTTDVEGVRVIAVSDG